MVSPDWANGMDDLVEFFVPDAERMLIANIDWLRYEKRDIPEETLAVLTEPEYQQAAADPRFAPLRLEKTILLSRRPVRGSASCGCGTRPTSRRSSRPSGRGGGGS